jgi:ssDNA-binding Zn-finger/Zn-ribbon topoisomerase 1
MLRVIREYQDPLQWEGEETAWPLPLDELRMQRDAAEKLTEARCPLCHGPLQVRMTRRGPAYRCLCDPLPV